MAYDYGTGLSLFDEDPDLPFMKQQALAQKVRANPALATPSSGVQTPPPQQSVRASYSRTTPPKGIPAQSLEEKLLDQIGKVPDAGPLMAYAQQRHDQANQNMLLGLALQAKGGEAFKPAGGQVLTQALKESGDYDIPGGWGTVTPQGVVWNPEKQQEAALSHLQAMYAAKERAETSRDRASMQQSYRDFNMQNKNQQQEDQARNHFDQITKDTRDVLNMGRVLQQLPPDGRLSPLMTQSLMILLNKFQDPGSVVREGEFNRVAEAQALLQKWGNIPAKIASGRPLPPAMMRDLQATINTYIQSAQNTMASTGKDYFELAEKRGLDPRQVVTDPRWHPRRAAPEGGGRGTAQAPISVRPRAQAPQGVIDSDF
jgi:hypothetical protein